VSNNPTTSQTPQTEGTTNTITKYAFWGKNYIKNILYKHLSILGNTRYTGKNINSNENRIGGHVPQYLEPTA